MNLYFKLVADGLFLNKLSRQTASIYATDEETKELIALMDNIPNARSVASMCRKMNRTGELEKRYKTQDPAVRWLEMEQYILNREIRRRDNQQKFIFMTVLFLILGFFSYYYGLQLLTANNRHVINTSIKR
ncbi:hypothetical protein DVR12_00640 [Chitinophaga silvatica]|uniref:Uncharacterized protein n=1 Tax=Chitinophaga silvatica TaxID=2282649 RepID=A0A3E1YGK2_9BACT|nr:hypothetical protein [Chitinophaga silvatica]RFS26330.1 hypothetical protein DVR12_00640 [Chitinophaga silvatica]